MWRKIVIASQCAHYSALRAAFGGCALYAPAGAVARERPRLLLEEKLSPKVTDVVCGEILRLYLHFGEFVLQ